MGSWDRLGRGSATSYLQGMRGGPNAGAPPICRKAQIIIGTGLWCLGMCVFNTLLNPRYILDILHGYYVFV